MKHCAGPSLFGFSMEDPGAAARLFKDFAKTNDKFEVKALSVSGQLMGASEAGCAGEAANARSGVGNVDERHEGA